MIRVLMAIYFMNTNEHNNNVIKIILILMNGSYKTLLYEHLPYQLTDTVQRESSR